MKPKPSEIALEAKKRYIPYIAQRLPALIPRSFVHNNLETIDKACATQGSSKLRVAVINGDPVDVALDWFEEERKSSNMDNGSEDASVGIPVVNMANERSPGGDWESGLIAQEENLCRRSNLVKCLTTPWKSGSAKVMNYPIPLTGGIYSPNVVVFRDGHDRGYVVWSEFKSLPVISVAPIRRPKLDAAGQDYAFSQEKELMKEKIRTVLRIAAVWGHRDLCVGAFGAGPSFRNPVRQLAKMWKDILFTEPEFKGAFRNIVFAIDAEDSPEYEAFTQELDASNVFKTAFR